MTRPSFQFYPADWRANSKLRRCSPAARGVWIDVLCALHDSDEYGIARYPLAELANEVGASMHGLRELVDKGVLKGADEGVIGPLFWTPTRRGAVAIELLPATEGPCWFSSRMLRDEHFRVVRAEAGKLGAGFGVLGGEHGGKGGRPRGDSTGVKKPPSKPPPSSSSSSSSSATQEKEKDEDGSHDLRPAIGATRSLDGIADAPLRVARPTSPPDLNSENVDTLNGHALVALATNFELPEAWGLAALKLGFNANEALHEGEKFKQYWTEGKGKGKRRAVKGWRQAWSNWLAKEARSKT